MYIVWSKKWTKWELVEEGKRMVCHSFNPLFPGYFNSAHPTLVDVYRRYNNKTGMYQYKNVERN